MLKTLNSMVWPAAICRRNGWKEGTRLAGDEGHGITVIEITAVGEREILAKMVSHRGIVMTEPVEVTWTLSNREWSEVGAEARLEKSH